MNNINTMSKKEFLFDHVFYIIISFIWFKGLLFRSIGFRTRSDSMLILWTLIIFLNVIGIATNWNKRRNYLTLFSNICIPFGIYTFLTYSKNFPLIWIIVIFVTITLSSLYCWLILSRKIKRKRYVKEIIKRRLSRCFLGTRTILSICLALIILPLGTSVIFGNTLVTSSINAETPTQDNEWTIANNIETVMNLHEKTWTKLSTKEKLNTMQIIANIEATYLGLPHELNVTLGTLSENTIAGYADQDHTITINIDHFDSYSAPEALDALCHEAYHAYQHRLCDAYDSVDGTYKSLLSFHNVQQYKYEFSNYADGDDDFEEYYFQACESSSRAYAKIAVRDYYDRINQHLIDTGQIKSPKETEENT